MSEKLTVSVKQSKTGYEGTVQLPGLKATKLTSKDGSTTFPNSSAVKTVARSVGKKLSLEVAYTEASSKKLAAKPTAKKASVAKKAAKPSVKKSAPKSAAKKSSAKKASPAKGACPISTPTSMNS